MDADQFKINRVIELSKVDAITLPSKEFYASHEFVLHVMKEYDYRYVVPNLRNTIINLIRKCINRQVNLKIRDKQCVIYQVPRKNLKVHATLKTEAFVGIYRRPEVKFVVDDHMFE